MTDHEIIVDTDRVARTSEAAGSIEARDFNMPGAGLLNPPTAGPKASPPGWLAQRRTTFST
jgi:hypothetical protein